MKKPQPKRPRSAKVLAALATAAALAFLLFTWSQGGHKRAEADFPHGGINFSISAGTLTKGAVPNTPTPSPTPVAGAQACDSDGTGGLPSKCTFAISAQFRLYFWLRSIPSGFAYQGYDSTVQYTSGLTVNQNSLALSGSGTWPECGVPVPFFGTGLIAPGCSVGFPPAPQTSSYTGVMWYVSFTCSSTTSVQTITLVHGEGNTEVFDESGSHGELAAGPSANETLTINCGNPPTSTFTPTSTRTPTRTPTSTATPTITNTPTITPTPSKTPTPSNTPTVTPFPSNQADVTITKTDAPDPVVSGGSITYSLLVRNIGQATATGVQTNDLLPPGVTFVSATSPDANCTYHPEPNPLTGTPSVSCNLKNPLPFNGAAKIVIVVTAPVTDHDIRLKNVASVAAANEPVFNQGNKADVEQTVVLGPRADVTLDVTDAPDPLSGAGKLLYTITAINLGPLKATNVVIKNNLPPGAVFKPGASSPECTLPVGGPGQFDSDVGELDVVCTLASLTDQATLQISVNMPLEKRDANVALLSYIQADNELFAQTGNNITLDETIILAPPPDAAIQKAGPVKLRRVAKSSYTLTVTNVGIGDAFNVVVSDVLPSYVANNVTYRPTIQSITGATCTGPVGNKLTCTIPKILGTCPAGQNSDPTTHQCVDGSPPNNSQVVITINVQMPTTVQDVKLTNQASVAAPNDPNSSNNQASVSTMLQACFDVTGDGVVRVDDVTRVVNAYGSSVGDPRYNVLYDFDGDGRIRVYDVVAVVNHYRQVCS